MNFILTEYKSDPLNYLYLSEHSKTQDKAWEDFTTVEMMLNRLILSFQEKMPHQPFL